MIDTPSAIKQARTSWLVALAVTAAIIVLHSWLWIHAGAFCGDEVNVIDLAGTHSLTTMTHDSFPVLLPLLVDGWTTMGLGGTDGHLRLLGLLVGIGLAGVLWLPAWSARRSPPFWSLILFGLNGTALYWTDYLRAYGLGTMLILLTLAAAIYLLAKPNWLRAAVFAAAAVLSAQALYQNAVFIAAICLGGWVICLRRNDTTCALKISVAATTAALSVTPYWKSVILWQRSSGAFRPGFSATAVLGNVHDLLAFPLPQSVWIWAFLALMVMVLGAVNLFRPARPAPTGEVLTAGESALFAGVVLSSSLLGYWIFLHVAALITSPWYFLPVMGLAAACFDVGIAWTNLPRLPRAMALGIWTATTCISIPFAARDLNCRFSNMDLVANHLKREISPQDYIVVTPWYLGISFHRYYHGPAAWDTLPPVADHATYRFDLVPTAASDLARAEQPVIDHISRTLQAGHRIWIVGWMSVPPPGRKAATPVGQFVAANSLRFQPVDLQIKGQTSDYENVGLLRAEGWKEP